ncbi:MAG TPA: tryptophan--tRNA ligase [Candidatus Binatia bacterium]|nr:tryptophan--tRNA ligase [Candidatus Binatia bacterium]
MSEASTTAPGIVVSGMRPTAKLHLGNLLGALRNWIRLQSDERRCFFFVADWHTLTTTSESEGLRERTRDMVIDWLAAGLDPERVVIFRQSAVKEHAELHLLLSMIIPTPWLLRNPTVKEQARDLGLIQTDDEAEMTKINYGHLGYPVLQAADIIIYKAGAVPVGIDQAPHIEITREIVRRFNHLYRPVFPEPATLLTDIPKIPGTDGRKMSKSFNNAVYLSDSAKEVETKLSRMMTDPRRARRTDPGDPNDCPAFNLHRIYCTPEEIVYVTNGCRSASIGCLECKHIMIKHVNAELAPLRERRAELERQPQRVTDVLEHGGAHARTVARATMAEVRAAMHLEE